MRNAGAWRIPRAVIIGVVARDSPCVLNVIRASKSGTIDFRKNRRAGNFLATMDSFMGQKKDWNGEKNIRDSRLLAKWNNS